MAATTSVSEPGGKNSTARAYRLLAFILLLRPFGNLCLAWGMKHFPQVLSINPAGYVRALFNPYVAVGVGTLILVVLMRMALLSLADLSFVLPLTASGYIVSTLLGKFILSEDVSLGRWVGTLLIFTGTIIVTSTSHKTTRETGIGEMKLPGPGHPLPDSEL